MLYYISCCSAHKCIECYLVYKVTHRLKLCVSVLPCLWPFKPPPWHLPAVTPDAVGSLKSALPQVGIYHWFHLILHYCSIQLFCYLSSNSVTAFEQTARLASVSSFVDCLPFMCLYSKPCLFHIFNHLSISSFVSPAVPSKLFLPVLCCRCQVHKPNSLLWSPELSDPLIVLVNVALAPTQEVATSRALEV
jgi:hypothetical protein